MREHREREGLEKRKEIYNKRKWRQIKRMEEMEKKNEKGGKRCR